MVEVDAPARVLADGHDLGGGFAPRHLVGVVLVGSDEHDGAVARIEFEHAHQAVDRGGRPGAAEDDDVIVASVHRAVDDLPGLLAPPRRAPARRRRLGVRVAVHRQDLVADELLDEPERPPRRRRVGVHHAPRTEGPGEDHVVTDHRVADALDPTVLIPNHRDRHTDAVRMWFARGSVAT